MDNHVKELNDLAKRVEFLEKQIGHPTKNGSKETDGAIIFINGNMERILDEKGNITEMPHNPKYSENDLRELFGEQPYSGDYYTRKKWSPKYFLRVIESRIISEYVYR